MPSGDDLRPAQTGFVFDGRFWNVSLGNLLAIGTVLIGFVHSDAERAAASATQTEKVEARFDAIQASVSDLKTGIGDMRTWRDQQQAENVEWKAEISRNFYDVNIRLDRLDREVGNQPDGTPPPEFVHPHIRK